MHHSLWMETIGSVACDALEWTSLHLSPSTPTPTPTPSTGRSFPGYHPHQERMGISKQELITMLEEEELKDAMLIVFANKQARSLDITPTRKLRP